MSRSDAQSMRVPCPGRPHCTGMLELRKDSDPVTVRCPKCRRSAAVEEFARTGQLQHPAAAR